MVCMSISMGLLTYDRTRDLLNALLVQGQSGSKRPACSFQSDYSAADIRPNEPAQRGCMLMHITKVKQCGEHPASAWETWPHLAQTRRPNLISKQEEHNSLG